MSETRFSNLLDALGADRLRAHVAERRLLHVTAPAGLDAASLLSRTAFEAALTGGELPAGTTQLFAGYHQVAPELLGLTPDALDQGQLETLAKRRTTLVATRLDRIIPHLWQLAHDAEQALGDAIGIGAVLSHGEATGIDLHFDAESLIIVQLEGQKTWRFYGPPFAASGLPQADLPPDLKDAEITETFVMHPGDILYVPTGLRHKCEPDGLSFHLGILMRHQTGGRILTELRDAARTDMGLFEPLVRYLGDEAVDAQAEAYKARLIALLQATDARALLDGDLNLRGAAFVPNTTAE